MRAFRLFSVLAILTLLAACGSGSGIFSATPSRDGGGGGGGGGGGTDTPTGRTRYSFNNQCFALKSASAGKYVASNGSGFAATAAAATAGEPFYLKPAALGQYLLYTKSATLLLAGAPASTQALASATDDSIFTVKAKGDATDYPAAPKYDVAPTLADLNRYRTFVDPNITGTLFTLTANNGQRLAVGDGGALTLAAAADAATQQFSLEPASGCAEFPEAHDNTAGGPTFKGTYKDPTTGKEQVLGIADVHVHMSSSTFLGGALHGAEFHKFGITHALGDCAVTHGPHGAKDVLAAAYENDTNGHNTDGWPTFSEWPSRGSLTHHAIYWKWIERAWKGGLRLIVDDMVENQTLCELQRNLGQNPLQSCNEMNSARRQVGTTYAMQDYIDAQYGGRGKGFFQIVLDPATARQRIQEGKVAVVIGVEISNLFNCQVTYSPLRQKEPKDEDGSGGLENSYGCAMTEDGSHPYEVKAQIEEFKALGIRQYITIHEFDNAFGGNGLFNDLFLNLGTRENSGGIPSDTVAGIFAANPQTRVETPTGEFWTTYSCPTNADKTKGFSGYLWGDSGGTTLQGLCTASGNVPDAFGPLKDGLGQGLNTICMLAQTANLYPGQGGRPGGTLPVYPQSNQCNARWLTPIGLYTYMQLMKNGMMFDVDHLEMAMKTQALELAEAQPIAYPFVSTHGTFGGETLDQAKRILNNGGFLYPSLGSAKGFISDMAQTKAIPGRNDTQFFGFGFGTDTDGLSGQEDPRDSTAVKAKPLVYPFTLFNAAFFNSIGLTPVAADNASAVVFQQPEERDAAGNGRTWHQDIDGNAHYGMMSDTVQELVLEGAQTDGSNPALRGLFNSAERYLQTWEQTLKASGEIAKLPNGQPVKPAGILRSAPKPGDGFEKYGYK